MWLSNVCNPSILCPEYSTNLRKNLHFFILTFRPVEHRANTCSSKHMLCPGAVLLDTTILPNTTFNSCVMLSTAFWNSLADDFTPERDASIPKQTFNHTNCCEYLRVVIVNQLIIRVFEVYSRKILRSHSLGVRVLCWRYRILCAYQYQACYYFKITLYSDFSAIFHDIHYCSSPFSVVNGK